jgi:murein DD-endopeptidase MepM/ murein hydrolase activator NlpD
MKRRILSFAVSLSTALALLGAPASAQSTGPIYIVQPGDTLSGIATAFGTTVDALEQANGITNPSTLQPGVQLIIPGFEGVSGILTTHTVAFGENLDSLSRAYGLAPDVVVRLNHIVNPGGLYVGEDLILPQAEGSEAERKATSEVVSAGQTRLEAAVESNLNPWSLMSSADSGPQAWLLPGSLLEVPGGNQAVGALPSVVQGVTVDPPAATQGLVVEVTVQTAEPEALSGTLGDWTLNFEQQSELQQVSLQGIDALIDPGLYDLSLTVSPQSGGLAYTFAQPYRIRPGSFVFDPVLTVPPDTIDPAVTGPEDALVNGYVDQVTPTKLWDGAFEYPTTYTKSFLSLYGSRRNYNGTGYNAYHTGLDLIGAVGAPIYAPAPGKVVFTGPLTVRGNTTIIDHGWGVFTMYLHQSQFEVQVGDMVETGQEIGKVGATGRVTGPHLHWEIRVGGVPVNPMEWVQRAFP